MSSSLMVMVFVATISTQLCGVQALFVEFSPSGITRKVQVLDSKPGSNEEASLHDVPVAVHDQGQLLDQGASSLSTRPSPVKPRYDNVQAAGAKDMSLHMNNAAVEKKLNRGYPEDVVPLVTEDAKTVLMNQFQHEEELDKDLEEVHQYAMNDALGLKNKHSRTRMHSNLHGKGKHSRRRTPTTNGFASIGGKHCDSHYVSAGKIGVANCATKCKAQSHCEVFTYGDSFGCRYSKCGSHPGPRPCPSDKQCPLASTLWNKAYKLGQAVDSYWIRTWPKTWQNTWPNVPITAPKNRVATLSNKTWPENYCVNFDVTFPPTQNSNRYGYEGAVVLMDSIWLGVVHTTKLFGGNTSKGMGLIAVINHDGAGPYYATGVVGQPGSRHNASFCFNQKENKPSWMVDKLRAVKSGYILPSRKSFPAGRTGSLSVLTGSHTSTQIETLVGGTLHSMQIRDFSEKEETPSAKAPQKT